MKRKGPYDDVIDELVEEWMDPNNPANQLKRPVKERCIWCRRRYTRIHIKLVDSGFCSKACEKAYKEYVDEVVGGAEEQEEWLHRERILEEM